MKKEIHAIKRARDRYGLELTLGDLESIAGQIRGNNGKFVGYGENDTTIWKMKWRKTWMRFVVSKDFYSIVTFLPYSGPTKLRHALYLAGRVA